MNPTPARAGMKTWLGLMVLLVASLLLTIDISVLYLAVPFISADLEPSGTELLWIIDIYAFGLAGLLITMGWIADRFGSRRLLMLGAAVFGLASLAAAYSTTPTELLASRAVLGVGAAALTPTALALIRTMFHDSNQRKAAIAAWTGSISSGAAIGPVIGGLLLQHFWWGSVFLINVPIMVIVLVLAPILLPEHRRARQGGPDLLGVVLSLASILPLIYGVTELAQNGYSPVRVTATAVGVVFAVLFVLWQRRATNPLIDLSLFSRRSFTGAILCNMVVLFAFLGMSLLTNQFMQLVLGFSPLKAALWSLAPMPVIAIAIVLTTVLSRKVRPAFVIGGGLLVMAGGFVILTQLKTTSSVVFMLAGAACLAAGMIASKTLIADIVVTAAPPERAGSAVGISETASEFGGALGLAVLGAIGTAVFHHDMANVSVPGLTGDALDAAQQTLGATAAVAQKLPPNIGSALLDTGRQAFTHGLTITATVGAITMAVVAALVFVLLGKTPVQTDAAAEFELAEMDEDLVQLS